MIEKKICKDCPNRSKCVELIKSEICPNGLHNVPFEEAMDYQAVWRGEKKVCEACEGTKFVDVEEKDEVVVKENGTEDMYRDLPLYLRCPGPGLSNKLTELLSAKLKMAEETLTIISMMTEDKHPPYEEMSVSRMGLIAAETLEKMESEPCDEFGSAPIKAEMRFQCYQCSEVTTFEVDDPDGIYLLSCQSCGAENRVRIIDSEATLEGTRPHFTKEQMLFLKDLLTPRCCHVTGEHDPLHYTDKRYVCYIQKAEAFDRGRELLGFGEVTTDEPVSRPHCYWCKQKE